MKTKSNKIYELFYCFINCIYPSKYTGHPVYKKFKLLLK